MPMFNKFHWSILCFFCVLPLLTTVTPSQAVSIADYNIDNATTYLMYSYSSYCQPEALKQWRCYWCETASAQMYPIDVDFFFEDNATDTFGYAGHSKSEIIFSFRGTRIQSLENVITDLESIELIPYPNQNSNMEVADGFYHAYQKIADSVRQAYVNLTAMFPDLPVTVTGHSLGGALSSMCAIDFAEKFGKSVTQWTFGCPRFGNQAFVDYYRSKVGNIWRTVNQKDIVPHYPFRWAGFRHPPTEVWFQKDYTHFKVCDSSGEDPTCSDSLGIFADSILDHLEYLGYFELIGKLNGC